MSRQNKVNPGQYTQRGRLTQDDAARGLKQQRSIGSQRTWQPVQKDQMPRPRLGAKDNDADRDEATTEDYEDQGAMPSSGKAKPAARVTTSGQKTAPRGKAKSATVSAAKKTTGKAKTGKAAQPAAKATATKTVRKAVLARNVGGGGSKPRQAAKRRKS